MLKQQTLEIKPHLDENNTFLDWEKDYVFGIGLKPIKQFLRRASQGFWCKSRCH